MGAIWRGLGRSSAERVVRSLLLVIIFCLPLGAVLLLSEDAAEVAGRYNTFAVPKLYLLEVVIAVTALLWWRLRRPAWRELVPYRWPAFAVLIAAASVLWAPYPELAAVAALHLLLALLLLIMLARELRDPGFGRAAVWTFVASAGLQAAWGIVQFAAKSDLGLQRIGESALSIDQQNIAKVGGDDPHIRAYGSLPHPNLLAAYLSTAIFFVGTVLFWPFRSRDRRRLTAATIVLMGLGAALVLTFSRVILALTVVNGLLVMLFSYRAWHRLPLAAGLAAAVFVGVILHVWPQVGDRASFESAQETGLTNRAVGYELAGHMITDRPGGVGAGNFVLAAPEIKADLPNYQYQPVHNAPMLIASELGAVAAVLVLAFVVRMGWLFHRMRARDRRTNTLNFSLFALSGVFVAAGLTDHFFWSLPQGLWLVILVAAAVISRIPVAQWEGRR